MNIEQGASVASLADCTITDIRCYLVEEANSASRFRWRAGLPGSGDGTPSDQNETFAILRMDTDAGLTASLKIGRGKAIADLTARRLKSLIGEPAMLSERLWHKVWELDRIEEFHINYLGLIDQLAWDLKSQASGLPLYQLLGGYKPRVRAYASTVTWDTMDEYERYIKMCRDQGFTAFKLHAWGDLAEDAKLARNLRKWVGPDAELMFDGSAGWDLIDSLKFGRVLEGEGYHWYEEPMREHDITSYVKLAEQLDIAVLACETPDGAHWNAATWISMGALDMMRTSVTFKGGLTGALKVAHLAEAHGMRAQVHGMGWANAHLCAAIPNNDFYENLVIDEAQIRDTNVTHVPPVIDGHITLPSTPGISPQIDWDALARTATAII